MPSRTTYKQCRLVRGSTGQVDTAWIPSEFARTGRALSIGSIDGWRVDEVYGGTTLSAEEFEKRRDNLRRFKWVLGE